uniref:Uncharacterized protein n=1 Tax=Micrurus paraensis TaxID=1970185 RepID=A0A2D4KLS1_9SAUR
MVKEKQGCKFVEPQVLLQHTLEMGNKTAQVYNTTTQSKISLGRFKSFNVIQQLQFKDLQVILKPLMRIGTVWPPFTLQLTDAQKESLFSTPGSLELLLCFS